MPKKSKGRNAYFFFMLDYKKREEKAGRQFPNGLKDVQQDPQCGEEWKNLPKQERGYYDVLAKKDKVAAQINVGKMTSDGTPQSVWEEKQMKQAELENQMEEYIKNLVAMGQQHKNLGALKFIFMHTSWFCSALNLDNETDYYPAEFAVCEFSLETGIGNTYHEIIKTKVPKKHTREALETSGKYHQIPLEFIGGESDFGIMCNRLVNFLMPYMTGSEYPPIYTIKSAVGPVQSLLNRLTEAADKDPQIFRIYSLEQLFTNLINSITVDTNMPVVTAEYELQKDRFSYERGLACKFHERIDGTVEYCSLSIVKRWGFTLADFCCDGLDLEMIPGLHKPLRLAAEEITSLSSSLRNMGHSQPPVLSMTGVSLHHKEQVSRRTYAEEMERRKKSEPVEVIDHSVCKQNKLPLADFNETALRAPHKTWNTVKALLNEAPSISEMNFPPLGGRGKALQITEHKYGLGRGRCGW